MLLAGLAVAFAAVGCSAGAPSQSGGAAGAKPPSANPYLDPEEQFPITNPPAAQKPTGNPFQGVKLWIDPESLAMLRANAIRAAEPANAAILDKVAKQPMALWLGEWNSNIYRIVQHVVGKAKAEGAVPVFVAYNVPGRDCGQHSAGGLADDDAYKRWIRRIAAAIDKDSAVIILEPDALPLLDKCLNPEQQEQRMALIKDAVRVLRQNPKTIVYIDSGHAVWKPAEIMAERLKKAGIDEAHGFALNTSNYGPTDQNIAFGKKVSSLAGNAPTTDTGDPIVDAFLWLKRPGESDGECNGGPKAGVFWTERAIELAK